MPDPSQILWFRELSLSDVPTVGGKNASLGEMYNQLSEQGVRVPNGFATTAQAYQDFLKQSGLHDKILHTLSTLDVEDVTALAAVGSQIRHWIMETPLLPELTDAITTAWQALIEEGQCAPEDLAVAVRSSATAEDLPEASFAGQQETFLNVRGIDNILQSVQAVFASLFNDRAIAYRVHQGFDHSQVLLSAGIQRMVRSDIGASGVAFTLDTESGFTEVVFITSAFGLGETIVQGAVNPDEFLLYKPGLATQHSAILRRTLGEKAIKMIYDDQNAGHSVQTVDVPEQERQQFSLTDSDLENLARQAVIIEQHYGRPMDVEWAKDGIDGEIYIVQARPETVKSREDGQVIERYELQGTSNILTEGRSIGQRIGKGTVRVLNSIAEMEKVKEGDVLVTDMTDPDWEPIMKRASAIVTNRGGRTCHAAIIARELGIPAVVGSGDATEKLKDGAQVTVSCAQGDTGFVYDTLLDFQIHTITVDDMPELSVKIMMNVANPERAFAFSSIPNEGIGLARLEFIISTLIGVHPKALLNYDKLPAEEKAVIAPRIAGYADPVEFYVEKLKEGIACLAAAVYPKPIIVRLSDFKSNEYAHLLGGHLYEPQEENPMLGFRGASRYLAETFQDCFALECQALCRVRNEMGLDNVQVMVPFVRTVDEGKNVVEQLAKQGLKRGENGLKIIMMCEIPSNAVLAQDFLQHFDGFSIGSNDLTQLTLGLDRDSGLVAAQFDERNAAVKALLHLAIKACKAENKYIGICGQGPSDHPDFAQWLMEEGIDSLSLNPDSVLETHLFLGKMRDAKIAPLT